MWASGAAFPLQGMTAHYLIHEFRNPKTGDFVLIHAAAGGVGGLLVQWAHHLGATVIGTASTDEKARTAKEAGADHVVVYSSQNFVAETQRITKGHGADLIIDGVGKSTFAGNLEAAAGHGHIVSFVGASGTTGQGAPAGDFFFFCGGPAGPADPISPTALMPRALSLSGGSLQNFIVTREDLIRRANDVMDGIRQDWLKLKIDSILPLAQAGKA